MNKQTPPTGLEGVVAGKTSICKVDGEKVELLYRGYSIEELAESSTFEEVAYILFKGEKPSSVQLKEFKSDLSKEMDISQEAENVIRDLPKNTDPMDALKIVVGVLGVKDPDMSLNTNEANFRKAMRLTAKIPSIITNHYHISKGEDPIKPLPDLSIAANFLYMLTGKKPKDYETASLDQSLILYAEHEYNASTFAARITASTLSDMHSAIVTAIGTLKGPLHGGANERAMEMLIEIGKPEKAEKWLKDALEKKKKIMGFGHRVYTTRDPRNCYIKNISKNLSEKNGENKWFEISEILEETMDKEKGMHPNLDFYASSAYYLLGIPILLYTPIFVMSRVTGWATHIMEQHENNRLIRPRAEYTGPSRRSYF